MMSIKRVRIVCQAGISAFLLATTTAFIANGVDMPSWYTGITVSVISALVLESGAAAVGYGKTYLKARRYVKYFDGLKEDQAKMMMPPASGTLELIFN